MPCYTSAYDRNGQPNVSLWFSMLWKCTHQHKNGRIFFSIRFSSHGKLIHYRQSYRNIFMYIMFVSWMRFQLVLLLLVMQFAHKMLRNAEREKWSAPIFSKMWLLKKWYFVVRWLCISMLITLRLAASLVWKGKSLIRWSQSADVLIAAAVRWCCVKWCTFHLLQYLLLILILILIWDEQRLNVCMYEVLSKNFLDWISCLLTFSLSSMVYFSAVHQTC